MPVSLTFQSCEKILPIIDFALEVLSKTGWKQSEEKMDNIPEDITPFDDEDGDTPMDKFKSLEDKFPPIGDQGQYGTCVAWSVGYNLKTALNAIEKGWSSSQLADKSNQCSPYDLWKSINKAGKAGSGCNGTNFEPALDAIIQNGVESLSSVPYTTSLNCSDKSPKGNSDNKLANYRKIASENEGLTPENFKGYLNAGRPISIGAKLGDRFMKWDNSNILNNDTYNNPGMQHAYHAMVLSGYDDNKQAFRVRNSWGTGWGDNGSIWVDYDFFCKSFCFAAFVAQNPTVSSPSIGSSGAGDDLLAFKAEDYPCTDDSRFNRTFIYDVYNSGTTTISPSQKWHIAYMIYNAKNAKEYEIIYYDYFTTEYGDNSDHFGAMPETTNSPGYMPSLTGGYWNNFTKKSGENVGTDEDGDYYEISYKMPSKHSNGKPITGDYYLVLMADAYDVIKEVNEDNNFYFITAGDGKPLQFINGEVQNMPSKTKSSMQHSSKCPALFSNTEDQTLVKPGNLNAYTPQEIQTMLLHDKKTGKLDAKIKAYNENAGYNRAKKTRK